eukprot:g1761.t1
MCILFVANACEGCIVANQNSGECVNAQVILEGKLNFCGPRISWFFDHPDYEVCVPRQSADTRAAGLTVQNKDEWVEETYKTIIRTRLEMESAYEDSDYNEHGIAGATELRFSDNSDCQNAFKNLFCWINFPRCNAEGASMMLCRSVCENYMISCGYDYDLWRCGHERYMNGNDIETEAYTDEDTGYPVYLRDFFPGHPFRSGRSVGENVDAPICTPGVYGTASAPRPSAKLLLFFVGASVAATFALRSQY